MINNNNHNGEINWVCTRDKSVDTIDFILKITNMTYFKVPEMYLVFWQVQQAKHTCNQVLAISRSSYLSQVLKHADKYKYFIQNPPGYS